MTASAPRLAATAPIPAARRTSPYPSEPPKRHSNQKGRAAPTAPRAMKRSMGRRSCTPGATIPAATRVPSAACPTQPNQSRLGRKVVRTSTLTRAVTDPPHTHHSGRHHRGAAALAAPATPATRHVVPTNPGARRSQYLGLTARTSAPTSVSLGSGRRGTTRTACTSARSVQMTELMRLVMRQAASGSTAT